MLKGKVALITGSTRGIGWATAELFARNGCTVVLNGRSDSVEEQSAALKDKYGIQTLGIRADFQDPKQIKECYQRIFKQFKQLDVVVNNAAVMEDALLGMISEDSINRSFGVNAIGIVHSMQNAARLMGRQKSGSIINISSIMGTQGNAGQVVYCATKAAVIGITKASAKELAPNNIRVNCVAPGFIKTELLNGLTPEKYQDKLKSIKMGRAGEPQDVANVVLFLASPLSEYVTGQVIGVDGAMMI